MGNSFLTDKSVIIASYTHIVKGRYTTIGGPALALRDYLKNKVKRLMCIWQPVPISDTLSAIAEIYEKNKGLRNWKFSIINWPFGRKKEISFVYIALKIRDVFSTIYFILKSRGRFDIFIGVEALNALVGVFLHKLGLVKTVIYYNLDYGKIRFRNPILNFIFHMLDKFAIYHVDYTWNLSEEMITAREKRGILKKETTSQLVVPIGINFSKINRLAIESIDRKCIVYLGLLAEKQGVQLIIEALPEILKKIPEVKLVIVGSGPLEVKLKQMVKEYKLEDHVKFTGLVSDEEVEEILCKCSIGIAPYLAEPDSTKKFTDPTKPKMYLACGLPVVITRVPPIATEIERNKAGIAIDYNKEELIEATKRLLTNTHLYEEYRKNAIEFISNYDWENIFHNTFTTLFNKKYN